MDMPFKNFTLIRTVIVASAILLGTMGVAYSHGGHGGGHHGGHHGARGHHAGHHVYHHGGRGYRHGYGYGRRGYGYGNRGYGWRAGYWGTGVAYPAGCGWVRGHRDRFGYWIPGRRVCY